MSAHTCAHIHFTHIHTHTHTHEIQVLTQMRARTHAHTCARARADTHLRLLLLLLLLWLRAVIFKVLFLLQHLLLDEHTLQILRLFAFRRHVSPRKVGNFSVALAEMAVHLPYETVMLPLRRSRSPCTSMFPVVAQVAICNRSALTPACVSISAPPVALATPPRQCHFDCHSRCCDLAARQLCSEQVPGRSNARDCGERKGPTSASCRCWLWCCG